MDAHRPIRPELLDASPGWRAGLVLDVRPAAAFAWPATCRARPPCPWGRRSAPAKRWPRRLPSIFLPPRHRPLLVVADDAGLARPWPGTWRRGGGLPVDALVLDSASVARLPDHLREAGPARRRLWTPPDWLRRHEALLPPPVLGPALDLACGSGRACVWLAERGYRVTGLDHQPEALDLGARLAASCDVACRFTAADLRRPGALPPGPWALVTAFRFLHRPLLDRLADLTRPGGVACLRTFREPPGYSGHPQSRHRLRRGELPAAFPQGRWDILAHEEGFDGDGLPAAGIVARRRAG